jgi:hypothetical protein
MYTRLVLVVVVLLALAGCTVDSPGPDPIPPPPPDVGEPVVLDTTIPGWQTTAWLSDETFCVRAARTGKHKRGKANDEVSCEPAPAALTTPGPALLPAKPLPYLMPQDPDSRKIILVGTVRGAIVQVAVTMFGQTETATVHAVPVTGGGQIGAYAVWLPSSGRDRSGMRLTDVTAVGYDASGTVIAQLT